MEKAPKDCPAEPLKFKVKKLFSNFSYPYLLYKLCDILVPTALLVFLIINSFSTFCELSKKLSISGHIC